MKLVLHTVELLKKKSQGIYSKDFSTFKLYMNKTSNKTNHKVIDKVSLILKCFPNLWIFFSLPFYTFCFALCILFYSAQFHDDRICWFISIVNKIFTFSTLFIFIFVQHKKRLKISIIHNVFKQFLAIHNSHLKTT